MRLLDISTSKDPADYRGGGRLVGERQPRWLRALDDDPERPMPKKIGYWSGVAVAASVGAATWALGLSPFVDGLVVLPLALAIVPLWRRSGRHDDPR